MEACGGGVLVCGGARTTIVLNVSISALCQYVSVGKVACVQRKPNACAWGPTQPCDISCGGSVSLVTGTQQVKALRKL